MIGFGEQPSYAKLVERLLGVQLDKKETFSDWTRRPLADSQIDYALNDVRYLLPAFDRLMERVRRRGRIRWVKEEWQKLEQPETYQVPDPEEQYRSVKRMGSLDGRGLAVLKQLAAWRERQAIQQDRPRGKIVSDELLVEIARRRPKSLAELKAIRGLYRREVERHIKAILAAVSKGEHEPKISLGRYRHRRATVPDTAAAVDLLFSYVKTCATREGIAASILISRSDLTLLVEELMMGNRPQAAVLNGWRRKLLGNHLLELLEGNLALRLDPETKGLKAVPAASAKRPTV
jgi:ribonuclease D